MSGPQSIGRSPRREVETEDYVAALARFMDGYGRRVGEDPAAIAHFKDLQQRLTDAVNVGLAVAQTKPDGWSLREISRYFGTSHIAVKKRVDQGKAIIARREQAAGVTRLADAVRPSVPAIRKDRADWLAEQGVEDYRPVRELRGRHRKAS